MNVKDGLLNIREQLVESDAREGTLALVDQMIKRASVPGADRAQASLGQLVTMLARTPLANDDVGVYDDLMQLKDRLDARSQQRAAEVAEEQAKPLPKSRKYYKRLKEKENS